MDWHASFIVTEPISAALKQGELVLPVKELSLY